MNARQLHAPLPPHLPPHALISPPTPLAPQGFGDFGGEGGGGGDDFGDFGGGGAGGDFDDFNSAPAAPPEAPINIASSPALVPASAFEGTDMLHLKAAAAEALLRALPEPELSESTGATGCATLDQMLSQQVSADAVLPHPPPLSSSSGPF